MKTESRKIIDKIKKLLSLATSSNENEANAAAERAQQMLAKYNLSMQQVDAHSEYIHDEVVIETNRAYVEDKYINAILDQHFFVQVLQARIYDRIRKKRILRYEIYGTEHNVEIATYVREFLVRVFNDLWRDYLNDPETPRNRPSKNSFYFGLYTGLDEKLKASRHRAEDEAGLVWMGNHKLMRYLEEQFPHLRNESTKIRGTDETSVEAGRERGKNITISKGIHGTQYRDLRLKGKKQG